MVLGLLPTNGRGELLVDRGELVVDRELGGLFGCVLRRPITVVGRSHQEGLSMRPLAEQ